MSKTVTVITRASSGIGAALALQLGSKSHQLVLGGRREKFDDIVAVVLKSVWYGMQNIVPHFQERGNGHLINVSSFLGRVPLVSYLSIYSATKSAVNVLTANLRMYLKMNHPGIHVSLVMPGIADTSFHTTAERPIAMRAGGSGGTDEDSIS